MLAGALQHRRSGGSQRATLIVSDEAWGANVPIFILTNIDEGTNTYEQVKDIADKYFIKSNTPLDRILSAIDEALSKALPSDAN